MWVAIVRCIWKHKNAVIFKQGVSNAEEIFHSIQLLSWLWQKYRVKSYNCSFSDWLMYPNQCLSSNA